MLLSVVITCFNSEDTIGKTLESIKDIADEIVVIDSGSTDRTIDIVKKYNVKLFYRKWINAGNQYNFAFKIASGKWILLIDSDEELSNELRDSIKKTITKKDCADCYMVNRKTYYLGKFLNHIWHPEWRVRLFKNGKVRFEERVHGAAKCKGSVKKLKGELYHYSFKSLSDQYLRTVIFAKQFVEYIYPKKRKIKFLNVVINPIWHFIKVYFLKKGFLDGKRGFMVAVSGFIHTFLKYALLYEMHLKEKYKNSLWNENIRN